MPTRLRRREAIFIRPGTPWSRSTRGAPESSGRREKLAARRDELSRFSQRLADRARAGRIRIEFGGEPVRTVGRSEAKVAIARLEGEITCETMLLDLDRRSIDLGTAAHEMIHQLAADSGLVPRHDAFPDWLHEGLAAQFEVIRGGRWSGISRAHDLRLPDWRKLQSPLPLERLVRDAGFGHGYQRDLYAQAWALVYYLRTRHPQRIPHVPRPLARPESGEAEPPATARGDRVFGAFQRAFGSDLDRPRARLASLHGNGKNAARTKSTARRNNTAEPTGSPAPPQDLDTIDRAGRIAKIVKACIHGA